MNPPAASPVPPPSPGRSRRRRRIFFRVCAGLLIFCLLAGGLLSLPAVQGWLVKRALTRQAGWRIGFARFAAGPTGVDVQELDFAMPGVTAKSAPITVVVAPWRLFSARELHIERIEATKLRVAVTPAQFPATTPEADEPPHPATPFPGLLAQLNTAWPWALDAVKLDGELVVHDHGESLVIGTFSLSGGGVARGQTGEFTYDVTVNSSILPPGPANKVHTHGTLKLTQDAAGRPVRLTLDGDLTLPAYGPLTLPVGKYSITHDAAPAGESSHAQVSFGSDLALDLTAQLDRATSLLTGHLTSHTDPALVARTVAQKFPAFVRLAMQGTADFSLNLRNGDLDATLGGDLDAGDWAALMPQLAAVDTFKGRLDVALTRRAGKISINTATAALRGTTSPAALTLALTAPLDPLNLPTPPPPPPALTPPPPAAPAPAATAPAVSATTLANTAPDPLRIAPFLNSPVTPAVARLTLEHWPLAWANPWLTPVGVQLAPAELNGEWALALAAGHGLRLTPARPFTLGPVALAQSPVPGLPPVSFSFSPLVELNARQAGLAILDFAATADREDRVDGRITALYTVAGGSLRTNGVLRGALPSLLADTGQSAPFTLSAFWDTTLAGRQLLISRLGFTARRDAKTPPYLSLRFLQPLPLDLDHPGKAAIGKPAEWLRVRGQHFPLAWLARWAPGCVIGGELVEGESALQSSADGRLTLTTPVPWRLGDVAISVGGHPIFSGGAQIAPSLDFGGGRGTLRLAGIKAETRGGNKVTGSIEFEAALSDRKGSTTIAFDANLPSLPHSAGAFGPLQASLRARFHNHSERIAITDELDLKVRNREGELLSLSAPQPFLFGLSNSGSFTTGTLAPLSLKVGAMPLAWFRPWTGGLALEGDLQPCELFLTTHLTKYQLRASQPVHVRNFAAQLNGRELARDTEFSFYPGLDLTFLCVPLPKFTLAYTATAHVSDGAIDVHGKRGVDLDLDLTLLGDTNRVLPHSVHYASRVDFGPMSGIAELAARGLPSAGTLVTRINGGVLGNEPIEVWGRLEGVPTADKKGVNPPFEFSARGLLTPEQVLKADISLALATAPRATDARFQARINLKDTKLEVASRLRSDFIDAAGVLALTASFQPPVAATPAPAKPATPAADAPPAGPRVYPHLDYPLWHDVRGHFDLEIGAFQYAPYRIDKVRGRLDVRDRDLTLSDLSGEMFAGRWSGKLQLQYDPAATGPNHTLDGEFRIEQFDSSRVVQTAFPNELSSVAAKINVAATVHSVGSPPLELLDKAEVSFTADGGPGIVRLQVPKQDTLSTAAAFGGTLLLSPELRALGRLLKKFAEMPVDTLHVSGQRTASGEVQLSELRLVSPQARIVASGNVAAGDKPLMERPLEVSIDLAAKDETAVILGGMSLLKRKPDEAGYTPMKEVFVIGGTPGQPDTRPLYDLLAKAVVGSKGTWGFLMRKMQDEVNKTKAAPVKTPAPAGS